MTGIPLPEYPRPQLRREQYTILNGLWDYAITQASPGPHGSGPADWDGRILVPFSPETELSGVGRQLQPDESLWYRRRFTARAEPGRRVILHFGAVDQSCRVLVDGTEVVRHVGGYLPFAADITDALAHGDAREHDDTHELVVEVRDVSDTSYHARGKQTLTPGGIWYTAQSGIWQTVWMETVPDVHVADLRMRTPDVREGMARAVLELRVEASDGGAHPVAVTVLAAGEPVARAEGVSGEDLDLGIDAPRTWSPDHPFLHDLEIELSGPGEADHVTSYVGVRSVDVRPDSHGLPRLHLNGRPYPHIGVLDQGYWPDGLYTAPTDEALAGDIAAMKDLGFTMLRKHIKIEPLRWYHHCDRLGMLVWQDMVNGGGRYHSAVITAPIASPHVRLPDHWYAAFARSDAAGREEFLHEVDSTVQLLRNSPAVVTWVPFNEGWGQFDAAAVARRVRALDPDRVIDHASGWHDQRAGDLRSLHVYFQPIRPARWWGRDGRALVVSEYGGYQLRSVGDDSGDDSPMTVPYRALTTPEQLTAAYARLHRTEVLPAIAHGLSATVYTQLTDVEDEVNGLLTADRSTLKPDADVVRALNAEFRRVFEAATATEATQEDPLPEREITAPTALCRPDGGLNPDAVGWSRHPVLDTSGIGRGWRDWGRNKRWEYWSVVSPTHIVSLTVSSLDWAAVLGFWVRDRRTGETIDRGRVVGPWSATLPPSLGDGPVRGRAGTLALAIDEGASGTRLRARADGLDLDVLAERPAGHESLAVVVPWSQRRFQYTVKDVARPARGRIRVGGVTTELTDAWAVLDHGRGRWPHDVRWNWAAAAGVTDGHVLGLQFGARWTDGTGMTENALVLDGRLTKISERLSWDYDPAHPLRPWTIRGSDVEVTLTPEYDHASHTDLGIVSTRGDQVFGTFDGWVRVDGRRIEVRHLFGWAEDVANKW